MSLFLTSPQKRLCDGLSNTFYFQNWTKDVWTPTQVKERIVTLSGNEELPGDPNEDDEFRLAELVGDRPFALIMAPTVRGSRTVQPPGFEYNGSIQLLLEESFAFAKRVRTLNETVELIMESGDISKPGLIDLSRANSPLPHFDFNGFDINGTPYRINRKRLPAQGDSLRHLITFQWGTLSGG